MATLIDTSVWVDFFRGVHSWKIDRLEEVGRAGQVVIGDLVLAEILQGIREDRQFAIVRRHLEAFPVLPMVGEELAVQSAVNYRKLRAKGITVGKTIDCLIATFCIERRIELLHSDRDFDAFERELGLRVARP